MASKFKDKTITCWYCSGKGVQNVAHCFRCEDEYRECPGCKGKGTLIKTAQEQEAEYTKKLADDRRKRHNIPIQRQILKAEAKVKKLYAKLL